jgi:hypothetical protein
MPNEPNVPNVEQELYRHVVSRYLNGRAPDGFDLDYNLIANGVFNFGALMNLVWYLEKTYAIQFDEEELVPEHFESIRALARLIGEKIAAQSRPPLTDDGRYAQLAPQLSVYQYDLGTVLAPYVMRRAPARFRSPVVNTDDYGYRLSYDAAGVVDSQSW